MKKILFFIVLFILFLPFGSAMPLPVDITADAAILYSLDQDGVVYEKNADKQEIMASLTKIMTAYTVIQNVSNLNEKVVVTNQDIAYLYGFTCAGLKEGDKVSYLDLLYAMMLPSGADASQTLAYHVGGSLENFKTMMNNEAKKLGLENTNFEDSYGGHDDNVSTAKEMMILLKTALENDTFKKVFTTQRYTLSNGLQVTNYTDSLAFFHGLETGVIKGSKSGFTPEAGLLLASIANINGHDYILILCKSKINEYYSTHVLETYKVFDYLKTQKFQKRNIIKKGQILGKVEVLNSTVSEYVVTSDEDFNLLLNDTDYQKVSLEYNIAETISPRNKVGDNIGYVDVLVGDEIVYTYNVFLKEEIFAFQEPSRALIVICVILVFVVIFLLCANLLMFGKRKLKK